MRQVLLNIPADDDDYEDERTLVLTADTISEALEWRNGLAQTIKILQGDDDFDDETDGDGASAPLMPTISC